MALVPGDRRADLDKIARAASATKARIATAAEVRDSTGFAPGAVAPFPLPKVELVPDRPGPARPRTVWIGAGSPTHLAALSPGDLVRLARARPIDAVQEQARNASSTMRCDAGDGTIWMNGEFVDWADAKVHVGVHGSTTGPAFRGHPLLRDPEDPQSSGCGSTSSGSRTGKLLYMELPFAVEEIRTAIHELVGRNGLAECYLRPFAFYGYGELGVSTKGNPVEVVVMSWPWGNYLGDENAATGIRCKISSWKRIGANTIPHVAKATGIYLNSMLAVHEAQNAGYDEAILLTDDGFVADGSGENIFVVKDGKIWTPPLHLDPARDHARQRDPDGAGSRLRGRGGELIRSDLYLAEEIFMTGTAAEVMPVSSVDDHEIGAGPITLELQKAYLDTVRGKSDRWGHWLDRVAVGDKTPAQA